MKILVIQNRMGIGDMIMFLPFVKAISNYYGEQISLMVKKNTKALVFFLTIKEICSP